MISMKTLSVPAFGLLVATVCHEVSRRDFEFEREEFLVVGSALCIYYLLCGIGKFLFWLASQLKSVIRQWRGRHAD